MCDRGEAKIKNGDGGWGPRVNVVCERGQAKIKHTAMPGRLKLDTP